MSLIKTDAVVLKVSDYSESTRLVTFLTPDHGRLRALAKGVRAIRSRDRGTLEPFSRVHVTLYLKDPAGLGTLRESALLSTCPVLRRDYHRWVLASLVFESLDRATLPATDLHTLFDLICAYLNEINTTPQPVETTLAVLAALLEWHGFRPDFARCGLCGGGEPFVGFCVDKCSVVCERCAGGPHFIPLPPGSLKAFEHLASAGTRGLGALRLSAPQLDQICSLLVALLQYHLEITLTTARMLHV